MLTAKFQLESSQKLSGEKKCFANTFCNCKNKKTNLKPERIHQLLTLKKYGNLYNSESRSDI